MEQTTAIAAPRKPVETFAWVKQQLVDAIDRRRFTYEELEQKTGISKRTIQKIKTGEIEDPGVSNVEKLANFFLENQGSGGA